MVKVSIDLKLNRERDTNVDFEMKMDQHTLILKMFDSLIVVLID